jgi:putative peptide zinc metalloprotease protein
VTATAEPPAPAVEAVTQAPPPPERGEGVELLGEVHGSGYKEGAALVRREDGQMVQLGPLMYALLECVDGRRNWGELAEALSERLGRRVDEEHVARLAQKLAGQGLLAGTEHQAPPRRNPLLALRWKVLVTDPVVTRRLTAPFTGLFSPWLMWPILACFAGVFWFVLIDKGVASATAQAFTDPGLLLLVFVLAVVSAGFHELGHAAACRYGGATPGGMGMGLYLVWPAFYTDVTDSYRLARRDRLRVDLGGLYFNAVVAVLTMAVWLVWRIDALLLLVALQVLQMVKQLSPVIRADGYHILSDATGVPDLYSHMGPTLRRLMPGHRHEPSALTGRARLLVTLWVLIIVPVLLSLMLGAIVLLPRLATTAWNSAHHILGAIPHEARDGQILALLASMVRLLALCLPVLGSVLVTQKIVRTTGGKALAWSHGRPVRRTVVLAAGAAAVAAMAWAWWPSGQYQPVRADQNGTLGGLVRLVSAPATVARPTAQPTPVALAAGTHLAVAMIPVGGASNSHPALFVIPGAHGKAPVAIISHSTPKPPPAGAGGVVTPTGSPNPSVPVQGTAFPFQLPSPPGPGGTQALAVNRKDGGVMYDVAYSLVTVRNGAPVTQSNSAYAIADCKACTTVAVSFQVVLVVGRSRVVAPINAAGALNYDCPACTTTAIADQIVVTLKTLPSKALLARLMADLKQLDALPKLGAGASPAAIASEVAAVQTEIESQLGDSGTPTNPTTTTTPSSSTSTAAGQSGSASGSSTSAGQSTAPSASPSPSQSSSTTSSTVPSTSTTTTATSTTTPSTTTTTTPSAQSTESGSSGTTITTPTG